MIPVEGEMRPPIAASAGSIRRELVAADEL